jgi:hypothetical protein
MFGRQVPTGRNGAAADASTAITAPDERMFHRIPSLRAAADPVRRRGTDGWRLYLTRFGIRARVAVAAFLVFVSAW